MLGKVCEAHPISPTGPLQISSSHPVAPETDIHLPAPLTLPGTTTSAPFPTPNGRWRTRLRAKLSSLVTTRGVDARLSPYMARAEERADACIGEILQTTGLCGPIAETQAVLGAKFAELAEFFLDHADPTTKSGRSDILLARACADTSRLNLDGALKTAHAIANSRPAPKGDPMAAFLDQEIPDVEPEPT